MAEKEIYHLDLVIGIKGDSETKSKLSAMDRYFEQTHKKANILNKMSVSPTARIIDKATSRIEKINSSLNKVNKMVASPTVKIKDKVSGGLNIIRNGLSKTIAAATSLQGALLGVGGAWAGVIKPMQIAGDFEQTQMAFTTMLHSAQKANSFLAQAQDMANATPFEFPDLANSSKKLLAFGWNVKQILPDLKTIGDTASGLGLGAEGINEITLALGQMKAKGRVQGDELLQLTEAGVPATKILQEQLGLTAKQVANIGNEGIDADKAVRALLTGMNQRFGGMMQNQAKTALGLMSTLKDTFENKLMNPWGQGLWSGIKPGLLKVTDWLDKNDKKVTELGSLFKKAGQNVSTFIGGALEKSQQRLSNLMDSSQWKNASLGGKITLAWDKVIAEPFSSWWNGAGRPKINKIASGIGSAIGGTIGSGIVSLLDALGGKKTGGAGTTAGTAFTNGFLQAFDTSKIVDKLISSFKNANLNALKDPSGTNIAKAGIMDYILFSSLGGAALLKGGFKLGKGAFKFGKWAFGKEGGKPGSGSNTGTGVGSTSTRASSASNNKASKTVNNLSEATKNFRNAVNEAKSAEKLRKSTQDKLNKAIKDYSDLIKKAKDIGGGKKVSESLSKKINRAQAKVDSARERAKSAGKTAKVKDTKSEAYTTARNTFKEARQANTVNNTSRAARFFKSTGKTLKKIPIVGNLFDFADIGLNVATATNKKKAAAGGVGNLAGGIAGAKAGATIGSIFGPIGTGVGGFAGSIIGSIGGEKLSSGIYGKLAGIFSRSKIKLPTSGIKQLPKDFDIAKKSIESKWTNTKSWFGSKVGTPLKNGAKSAVNFTVGAFSLGKEAVQRKWAPVGQWLSTNVFQPIKGHASSAGSWIASRFGSAKSWAQTHWSGFSSWWGKNVSTPVSNAASRVGSWIGQRFSSARQGVDNIWAGFSGWWSKNVASPTKNIASSIGSWIEEKFSNAKSNVQSSWSDFSSWWSKNISGPINEFITNIIEKGQSITGWGTPNTKANGGITSGPELSWIGEAGTEAIIPLSSTRRNRGLQLWQQAGKMLGVRMFANGGIVGGGQTQNNKAVKAAASISTSVALGNTPLDQFKQYGTQINKNLSAGINESSKIPNNSVNKVTDTSKGILNNFSQKGHVYGVAVNNDIASGINSSMGNVTGMVKTLTDKVITQFKTGFGIHSPSRVFYKLAQFIPQGFINGLTSKDMGGFIKHWIGDISSMAGGAMSGNVSAWLTAALGITGTPMNWLSGLLRLTQAESGGNPLARNPQSVGGEHATGLLQTLPSTFAAYAVKGLNNILNPIANAAAAINYIKSTYGSVYNTPLFKGGSYVGYATGTDNAKPGLARINEKGWEFVDFTGGENVLNHNKSVSLMERAASSINRVKSAVSNLGIRNTESRDIPESSSDPVYYTSQPQMAMAGASYGDINVDVENNFNDSTDVDGIVEKATVQFARQLKAALLNKKK